MDKHIPTAKRLVHTPTLTVPCLTQSQTAKNRNSGIASTRTTTPVQKIGFITLVETHLCSVILALTIRLISSEGIFNVCEYFAICPYSDFCASPVLATLNLVEHRS
jgi:hypothetical protein